MISMIPAAIVALLSLPARLLDSSMFEIIKRLVSFWYVRFQFVEELV